ncbi:uncharacterized protein L3040_002593 [Drepanopeziza brunnea f. sp. 'multigermtubi']|uniref:Uncharacterized protein n=1 Tax=Marssonina brunnea f. sp. multigermtubi (strain MB_m1) TaxID=1072389 RepID=K1Y307_MARBU|nr:uncharacterized protein MBM_02766 [Drepanopeziza brunnea f. sp. 'multigermtubi' MB_m1]EKD19529.1 hypothetical protein MBM_02766 [Drepanopeziza brunnea f. sp. 'multigermtubi' MB_m1]KAJ5050719.1 hypothetical protein L3040_002593 [Drepanopeziza brunnea f. sp. 'multigermtubi']
MADRRLRHIYGELYPGRSHSRLILPEDFHRAEAATTPHIASDFRQWMQSLIGELREIYEIIRNSSVTIAQCARIARREQQRVVEDTREAYREWANIMDQWETLDHERQRLQEIQDSNEQASNDIENRARVLAREKEDLTGLWVDLKDELKELERKRAEIQRRELRWLEDEKPEVAASAEVEVQAESEAETEDEATGDEPVSVGSAPVSSGDGEEKANMFAGMFEPIFEATTRWLAKKSDEELGDKSDSGRILGLQDQLRHLNAVMEDGYSLDIAGRKRSFEIVTELWMIVDPPVEEEKPNLS